MVISFVVSLLSVFSPHQDWDKPEHIPDPDAKKPEDWDDEMDGEWEPPMIQNPEYKVTPDFAFLTASACLFCIDVLFDISSMEHLSRSGTIPRVQY